MQVFKTLSLPKGSPLISKIVCCKTELNLTLVLVALTGVKGLMGLEKLKSILIKINDVRQCYETFGS